MWAHVHSQSNPWGAWTLAPTGAAVRAARVPFVAGVSLAALLLAHHGIAADKPDARAQPVDIAITTVSIVDVERGRVLPPRTVLVTNGRIVGIEADANLPLPATAQRGPVPRRDRDRGPEPPRRPHVRTDLAQGRERLPCRLATGAAVEVTKRLKPLV